MAKHEAGNGNNIRAAFEQAEKERREREIKVIEKHLKTSATETDVRVIPDEIKQKLGNDISDENLRLYNRLPDGKKEGLLAKLVSEGKVARKHGRKRGSGKNPHRPAGKIGESSAPAQTVPAGLSPELLHAVEKAESTAQPVETPAEKFAKRADEVAKMLEGHNLDETAKKVADGTYAVSAEPADAEAKTEQETEPSVFRSNREKKEKPSFEERKKYLNGRDNELGAKAKEYGLKIANFVHNKGEWYRKLPLKYKIGVAGALLGLNVATGGASTFITLLTSTAMLGQRALGSAATYALMEGLLEKRLARKEKERGSERTKFEKWKKQGYSTAVALAVFSGLPGYAVKEGFSAVGGGELLKMLGNMMGHSTSVDAVRPPIEAPVGAQAGLSVEEATKIMEQAKEQLAKEITARDEIQAGLDQVKQQIAEEKARVVAEASTPQESRQALRTAVEKLTRVGATADAKFEMPKHADFSIHEDDTTISPYDVTPTDQSGVDDDIVQASEEPQSVAEPEVQQVQTETPIETAKPSAESVEAVPEAEAPAEPLPNVKVPEPERYEKVDLTGGQTSVETADEVSTPAQEIITNSFGLNIPTAEPHIYAGADAGHTFVFGGTPTERANVILQYLRENPNKVVFGPDDTNTYRIPWHLVEGKLTPGSPMRTSGLFGFLSMWMKVPGPEDLQKIIK